MFDMDFILANTVLKRFNINEQYLARQKISFETAAERHTARYEEAFKTLADLMANGGTIRKVEYISLKYRLDHAVEECYENHVNVMFSERDGTPVEERTYMKLNITKDISFDLHISSILNVAAVGKKLAKLKMGEANEFDKKFVALVQKMVDVFLPVQQAIETLKKEDRIVKGRAPRAEPVPENPNKDIKTCPCCFRAIAVMGGKDAKGVQAGTMAHHGFERPGEGYQTASCPGIRFKCLEVSTEGLVWYIKLLSDTIDRARETLKNLPNWTETLNPHFHHEDKSRAERKGKEYKIPRMLVKTEIDPKDWNAAIASVEHSLHFKINSATDDRAFRQKILDNWKPGKGV